MRYLAGLLAPARLTLPCRIVPPWRTRRSRRFYYYRRHYYGYRPYHHRYYRPYGYYASLALQGRQVARKSMPRGALP
jgi:hypothetical protein